MVHRIKLSREHKSAWKQTAKTEVTPLPQKNRVPSCALPVEGQRVRKRWK